MLALGKSLLVASETSKSDNWSLEKNPNNIEHEARKVRASIRSYRRCFHFSLRIFNAMKETHSHLANDDHPNFWRSYRSSVFDRIGI